MKILITGASGLLGSEIVDLLEQQKTQLGITKILKQRQQPTAGFISLNLAKKEAIKQLADAEWDVIIHTAANRDPDACATDSSAAQQINANAPTWLAAEAQKRNAYMLYISTDYVFPGTDPPYSEHDPTDPINHYGKTKLQGEQAVLVASSRNCSLRVPFLYGIKAGIAQSPMLAGSIKALLNQTEQHIDNLGVRYPTYTGDVAQAVILLLNKKAAGIYHCSGEDKMTKYRIATSIGELLGLSHRHIHPQSSPTPSIATRPHDCHLLTSRLKALGWSPPLPLLERLRQFSFPQNFNFAE